METQVNQFIFREPKKVELKSVEFSSFSHRQLVAIIKSASYLIAADNRFTNEEKSWLWLLCSNANVSNPQQAFEESHGMDVNEMFTSIYSMSKEQKDTVLYYWILVIQSSSNNPYPQRTFNLNSFPNEKPYFIDMARRCNIDISAFINGPVQLI